MNKEDRLGLGIRVVVVMLGCLAAGCPEGRGDAQPRSTAPARVDEHALKIVEGLRATRMGVNRQGQLWAWDQPVGSIELVSPSGERRQTPAPDNARDVDVDEEWGVVALTGDGLALHMLRPGGAVASESLPLSGMSESVAWISATAVAVAPSFAAHRVEIWDISEKARIAAWGEEKPIQRGVGATLRRNVALKFDHGAGLLYTLDTFSGDLQVFGQDGTIVRRAGTTHPRQAEMEEWLRKQDRDAKAQNRSDTPSLRQWDGFGLTADRSVWMVQQCRDGQKQATLTRFSEREPPVTLALDNVACCSYRLTIWGDNLVMHRDPQMPRVICNHVQRRFP